MGELSIVKIFFNKHGQMRCGFAIIIAALALLISGIVVSVIRKILEFVSPDFLANIPFEVISYPFNIASILLAYKLVFHEPVSQMGLFRRRWMRELLYGLAFGIVSISVVYLLMLASSSVRYVGIDTGYLASGDFWYSVFFFILVGFFEEILTRGYFMSALRSTHNRFVVLFVPPVVFGLMHFTNPSFSVVAMINITLVGILFAYTFVKSGKLWMPIGYHISWNFFQGNVFGFEVSGYVTKSLLQNDVIGSDLITGGGFGAEGGLVVTVVIIAGIVWTHLFVKQDTAGNLWEIENWK